MDFPTYELSEIPVTDAMEQAFGVRPIKAILGLDLICVFETEEQVRSMHPDQELLKGIEGRIQNATAAGKDTDCVSRSFCPKLAIAEDPVCGSAHCQIADYWSGELGTTGTVPRPASLVNHRVKKSPKAYAFGLFAVQTRKQTPWFV